MRLSIESLLEIEKSNKKEISNITQHTQSGFETFAELDLLTPIHVCQVESANKQYHAIFYQFNYFPGESELFSSPELLLKLGTYERSLESIQSAQPTVVSSNNYLIASANRLRQPDSQITPQDIAQLIFSCYEVCNDCRTFSWYAKRPDPLSTLPLAILNQYLIHKKEKMSQLFVNSPINIKKTFNEFVNADYSELAAYAARRTRCLLSFKENSQIELSRNLGVSPFYSIEIDKVILDSWLAKCGFKQYYGFSKKLIPLSRDSPIIEIASYDHNFFHHWLKYPK